MSKSYFNQVATKWDQMRKEFFPPLVREKAIDEITIFNGAKIADIGCGSGFISEGLQAFPVEIYAIDESPEMLETMKAKFLKKENIHYILAESENIQLPNEQIDYALANMYLHHVERPEKAITEIYRILKPGGKLVITDLDNHDFEFLRVEQHDRWMGFDRADIKRWYQEAGFVNVNVDCLNANCCSGSQTTDQRAEISIFIASGVK